MRCIALIAGLFLAGSAFAQPVNYQFDKVHSQIHASASHLGFSQSTGRFLIEDGSFSFDPADWSSAKVEVVINAASLDFGDDTWNEHMRADKFFNTAQFPKLRFVSTQVSGSGSRGTVQGELELLGMKKPVTLDVSLNKIGDNPFSKKQTAGFSATATLKRSDWGMTAYVPGVGDEVTLRIEIEAAKQD